MLESYLEDKNNKILELENKIDCYEKEESKRLKEKEFEFENKLNETKKKND